MSEEVLYVDAWPSRAILVETRRMFGLTTSQLDAYIGCGVRSIHAIENGRYRYIHWRTAERIAGLRSLLEAAS